MNKRLPAGARRCAPLAALLITLAWAASAQAQTQCVDSSAVTKTTFKVRAVKLKTLFGLVPADLRRQLAAHRNDVYSADKALAYEREVRDYLSSNPAQQKYEKLVANKLKFAAAARVITLDCMAIVPPAECQTAFSDLPGGPVTQCVDVTLKAQSLDIDVLNTSPHVVPLPRSILTAIYGAIPRPLLALNPSFDGVQDAAFGPGLGLNTATDLLKLKRVLTKDKPAEGGAANPPGGVSVSPDVLPPQIEFQAFETPRALTGETAADKGPEGVPAVQLLLGVRGRKSLTKDFYNTSTGLTLVRTEPIKFFQRLAAEARFDADSLPQGNGDFLRNAASVGFNTDLRLTKGPVQLVTLGGKYHWARNRFTARDGATPTEINTEHGFEARAAADGLLKKGLLRAALWFDGGTRDHGRGTYHRLAGLVGYGKEISLPRKLDYQRVIKNVDGHDCLSPYAKDPLKSEQTFGLEVLAGAGRAWGAVPEYARFFGGSQLGSYLYDELSSPDLASLPFGPVLRSTRLKQAGVAAGGRQRGGTSYWHANVNLSVPVAAWSRPLIPHEWVQSFVVEENDPEHTAYHVPVGQRVCVDLRRVVKQAMRESGPQLLIAQRARDMLDEQQKKALRLEGRPNLTPEQQTTLDAAKQAYQKNKETVTAEVNDIFRREVFPVADFLADHANFIAVKPLLLFDAARVSRAGSAAARTRYGAGGGLQIDVVLARFELGYVFGLNRLPGDGRGNFVGRLVVKRFL
ncbi:MAG TPA: hypothetical protein VF546_01430 [Pyrinomonadaceae bacterium]|jgi:hypothetical protein